MAKTLTPEKIYESISSLPTEEQIKIWDFIKKLLDAKKEAAAAELQLINGGKR